MKQCIIELKIEKAKLKAELKTKNSEISKLKKKLAEVKVRNVKIKIRNANFIKQMIEKNNWRDVRIENINNRVVKLEQK